MNVSAAPAVVQFFLRVLRVRGWIAGAFLLIAAAGFYGSKGPFWAMPSLFLTGTAAASGIAWINAIGNLGGFFGPTAVGWAKEYTGSFAGGLYALACFSLVSAIVSAFWLNIPNPAAPRAVAVPAE